MATTFKHGPADGAGADDDHTSVKAAMRTNAGRIGVCRDCGVAERIFLRLRRGQCSRFAGACERQTGGYSRQIRRGQTGLMKTKVGRLAHRRETILEPEPDVSRAGNTFAQDRAGGRTEPRAAFCSTAVYPKKEQVWPQSRPFCMHI